MDKLIERKLPFTATNNNWVFWPLAFLAIASPWLGIVEWALGFYLSYWLLRRGRSRSALYWFLALAPSWEALRLFPSVHGVSVSRIVYGLCLFAMWLRANVSLTREMRRYLKSELNWEPSVRWIALLFPIFLNWAITPAEEYETTPAKWESDLITLKLS